MRNSTPLDRTSVPSIAATADQGLMSFWVVSHQSTVEDDNPSTLSGLKTTNIKALAFLPWQRELHKNGISMSKRGGYC